MGNPKIAVDELPVGWGVDGLVAQRFLGWSKGKPNAKVPYTFYWADPKGSIHSEPPACSSDMNQALILVEALFLAGWKFGMTLNSDASVGVVFVPAVLGGYDATQAVRANVPSIKLAALCICRAALLVAEKLAADETRILQIM